MLRKGNDRNRPIADARPSGLVKLRMSLIRTTAEDRAEPWGRSFPVEATFELEGRGVIFSVRALIPGSTCSVRIKAPHRSPVEQTVSIGAFVGDHCQTDLLARGRSAADFPEGTEVFFIRGS